jgi:hypothetical protein
MDEILDAEYKVGIKSRRPSTPLPPMSNVERM